MGVTQWKQPKEKVEPRVKTGKFEGLNGNWGCERNYWTGRIWDRKGREGKGLDVQKMSGFL